MADCERPYQDHPHFVISLAHLQKERDVPANTREGEKASGLI